MSTREKPKKTTLAEALERYEREVTTRKRCQQEHYLVASWRRHHLAQRPFALIRSKDVADFIEAERARGLSANTIRLHLAVLSHLYEVARRDWGMETVSNPVAIVHKPKLPHHRDRRLQGDEEKRLLEACQPLFRRLVEFALETGMRRGEISSLRWTDVNLEKRVAVLPETKTVPRRVPLSGKALEILKSLPRRLDGKVFGLSPIAVTHNFEKACRTAGIQGLTFHDLRHECLSRLAERGFDIPMLAAVSGHKSWAALKRYVNLRPKEVARKLG